MCSPAYLFLFLKISRLGVCPGSHTSCEPALYLDEELEESLRDEFDNNSTLRQEWDDDFSDYYSCTVPLPCNLVATTSAGDGLLYNSELHHRGRAHTDPNAPDRVLVFLVFAESLVDANDTRTLPLGQQHLIGWNFWGHTIDEFTTIDKKKWRFWHSVGLFRPKQSKDIYRPWNILDSLSLIFRDYGGEEDQEVYHWNLVIDFSDFRRLVEKLLLACFSTWTVYLLAVTLWSCYFTIQRTAVESCKKCHQSFNN
jgi:hypothetical protein